MGEFMGYLHKIPRILLLNRKRSKHHKHQINTMDVHMYETKWGKNFFLKVATFWARQHHRRLPFVEVPIATCAAIFYRSIALN